MIYPMVPFSVTLSDS